MTLDFERPLWLGAAPGDAASTSAACESGSGLASDDAQPANASAATKAAYARHENFEKLGANFKALNDGNFIWSSEETGWRQVKSRQT